MLNFKKNLAETLELIKDQINRNFEFIIFDGKSSDHKLKIINKYKKITDFCISKNFKELI